ncbi:hypothetical protein C0585_04795 [Candidatus Woesearchaeota archaeon]|nr:MAG: hypothetical protein C0585_04795 [Candidatus Woesearchaeota archaeon]
MEKMTTRAEFIERLKEIRAVEILARKSYLEDVALFKNSELKVRIQEIKDDEDKHILILEQLIYMLEN